MTFDFPIQSKQTLSPKLRSALLPILLALGLTQADANPIGPQVTNGLANSLGTNGN